MIEERRKHIRESRQEKVIVNVITCEKESKEISFECLSKDFSAKGVRLHGHQGLDLNTKVNMIVHLLSHKRDYSLAGQVKWVTETTENEQLAGVELLDMEGFDLAHWQELF